MPLLLGAMAGLHKGHAPTTRHARQAGRGAPPWRRPTTSSAAALILRPSATSLPCAMRACAHAVHGKGMGHGSREGGEAPHYPRGAQRCTRAGPLLYIRSTCLRAVRRGTIAGGVLHRRQRAAV